MYRYGEEEQEDDQMVDYRQLEQKPFSESSLEELKRKKLLLKVDKAVKSWTELFNALEIPPKLLREADGIVLVHSFKIGVLASLSYGTGILIVQNRRSCKPNFDFSEH